MHIARGLLVATGLLDDGTWTRDGSPAKRLLSATLLSGGLNGSSVNGTNATLGGGGLSGLGGGGGKIGLVHADTLEIGLVFAAFGLMLLFWAQARRLGPLEPSHPNS